MLSATAKRFKLAELGDTVMVSVPDVDGGRSDFRNITGVITNIGQDGTYSIGTKHGILKQPFARSQFIPNKGSFLNIDDVPGNEVTTVQKVVRPIPLAVVRGSKSVPVWVVVHLTGVVAVKLVNYAIANVTTLYLVKTNK